MHDLGVKSIQKNLTVHTVGVTDGEASTSNGANLRWSLAVSNPAKFIPLWKDFSKSIEKYEWLVNGYGFKHII